ncbi:MAG: S8 family serine peptidase, partial [Synergistaceae bacterium]|nr:S8 family serine peptidase [Synergistaceae bacterium]
IGKSFFGSGLSNDITMDQIGHGTHVAGIIGAAGKGIAGVHYKNIKIIPVRAFINDISFLDNILNALDYLLELRKGGLNLRVVNMSLGGWHSAHLVESDAYEEALKALSYEDVIIVVAAGNEGREISTSTWAANDIFPFPASYLNVPNKITVGSINPASKYEKSSFSNYDSSAAAGTYKPAGRWLVDMAAPGEQILSTVLQNKYDYYRGTSMAAPFVSGAAALLCSVFHDKTAGEIKEAILESTFPNTGGGKFWGYGCLDVGAAYLALGGSASVKPIIKNPPITAQKQIELRIEGKESVVVNKTISLSVVPGTWGVWEVDNTLGGKATLAISEDLSGHAALTGTSIGRVQVIFTPVFVSGTPAENGVKSGTKTIRVDDIYHEGTAGCNAGMTAMLAVPIALFFMTMVSRRRKR